MTPSIILAIDPGGTTGIAWKFGDEHTTAAETEQEEVWKWVQEFADLRVAMAETFGCAVADVQATVLIETFASSMRTSQYGLHTIELVGAVKALCWNSKLALVRRMPQHRRPCLAAAREILRAMGEPFVDHEVDALAHILAWERRRAEG